MKKMFLLLALGLGLHTFVMGQDLLNTAKNAGKAASAAGIDVNSLTKGIMGKLVPSLGLSAAQQPSVTSTVSSFLTDKSSILSLKKTDPAAYASKFSGLFGKLKSKLGGVLTAAQMTKFLGLKPKANDVTNVLSNLFY